MNKDTTLIERMHTHHDLEHKYKELELQYRIKAILFCESHNLSDELYDKIWKTFPSVNGKPFYQKERAEKAQKTLNKIIQIYEGINKCQTH